MAIISASLRGREIIATRFSQILKAFFLVPQVYNARRFDIDLSPFPHVKRVVDTCNGVDSFDTAAPEQQPDSTVQGQTRLANPAYGFRSGPI